MAKKEKNLYYAVSARGQGVVFTDMPVRVKKLGIWSGTIEGCYCSVISDMEAEELITLPEMCYDDEPLEIKLTVSYGRD